MTDDQTPAEQLDSAPEGAASDAARLAELEAEVAALKDQALRYLADAENTRRRAEREVNDARAYAIQRFAQSLFGVADTLTRALAAKPQSQDPAIANFVLGIEMTEKSLQQAFEANGVMKIEPAPGDRFDPHKHDAMMEQESAGVEPGAVLQTMQAGYELHGRTVRPAMVVVARKASVAEAAGGGYAPGPGVADGGALDTKA